MASITIVPAAANAIPDYAVFLYDSNVKRYCVAWTFPDKDARENYYAGMKSHHHAPGMVVRKGSVVNGEIIIEDDKRKVKK